MLRMFNFAILIVLILFGFVLFRGCGIKSPTFYDIDKAQLDADKANKICNDSVINCRADFGLYSEKNKIIGYSGIWADLIIERDSTTSIENIDMEISPSKNQQYILPISFDGNSGNSFDVIKDVFNEHSAESFQVDFEVNTEKYDSLYLKINIKYTTKGISHEINAMHIYKKGYRYEQLSR